MNELSPGLTWQDIATVFGILFGIISTIGYIEQRRSSKDQAALIEFARLNVDKDITKESIKSLQNREADMQQQITKSIPVLARVAVLKEQRQGHAEAISTHYQQWRKIEKELNDTDTAIQIEPEIEKQIIDRILPKYEREYAIKRQRNRITAYSVAMALVNSLLPDPTDLILTLALAFPLIISLFRLFRLQEDSKVIIRYISTFLRAIYIILIVVLGWLVALTVFSLPTFQIWTDFLISFLVIALFIATLVYSKVAWNKCLDIAKNMSRVEQIII